MNWEEYENSDFYRESHPEKFERESPIDKERRLTEDEMRTYLGRIDEYRKRRQDDEEKAYEQGEEPKRENWVAIATWNFKPCGVLAAGDFETCALACYKHNVACIHSDWDYSRLERMSDDPEEFDEELIALRDDIAGFECGYYDYDEEW